MRRRALLAGVSTGLASLAGCSDSLPPSTDTSGTVTPVDPPTDSPATPPEDPDGPGLGAASVIDLQTNGATYALAPLRYRSDDDARVQLRFASTATADAPATVAARLTNENPVANSFRLEWTPPFGRPFSEIPYRAGENHTGQGTYRDGLVLAPRGDVDVVDDPPEIERDDDGHWRLAEKPGDWFPEHVRLAAGESLSGTFAVVGRPEGVGRDRPSGVYEFTRPDHRPLRITVWETGTPGPTGESRFGGASLPSLPGDATTAWFHEADRTTASFVRPSVERTDLPARVEFTFVNRSRGSTSCGHWTLYKLVDSTWYRLGPDAHTADCRVVPPGGWKTWSIRVANGEMAPCEARSFPFLGGGRYAAVAGYGHATPRAAALVAVNAPSVTIVPTDDVIATRSNGTVTATAKPWRTAPDDEHRSRAELVLEPAETAERTVIAEQVMRRRRRGFRNTLAFADQDVERVVLRTDDQAADRALGYGDGQSRFRFDGDTFVLARATS